MIDNILSTSKVYGTNAERLAMNLSGNQTEIYFYETDAGSEYLWKGSEWVQTSTNGAAHVTTMPGGQAHGREHIALSTTAATFDWSSTPIKAVSITVTADTAGTAELNQSVVICIDPPSTAVRDAWLTEGTNLTGDTQRISIPVNTTRDLVFTSSVSYIGLKLDDGTGTVRVFATGVEA